MAATARRCLVLGLLGLFGHSVQAADWPIWRYDENRCAATPQQLPAVLQLNWVREFPAPQPAWPDDRRVHFDLVYEPAVMGKTVFVGLNATDKVVALDTESGAEKWTFYTGGPVRFAPVAWEDRLFVASDDGHLYCLGAAEGSLLWKFRGGPSERTVLGNGRLISTWCARGGPLFHDGKVYFGAGIWPFMGVFIHALDAKTGEVIWTNDGSSHIFSSSTSGTKQLRHFVGLAPQGYLLALGDKLVVPCGRSTPYRLDLETGKLLHYAGRVNHRRSGTWEASGIGDYLFNGPTVLNVVRGGGAFAYKFWDEGKLQGYRGYSHEPVDLYRQPRVLTDAAAYTTSKDYFDINQDEWDAFTGEKPRLVKFPDQAHDIWIKAGPRLYGSKGETVLAIDLPDGQVSWQTDIDGEVGGMIAAAGKLFVSTRDGRLYCFAESGRGKRWPVEEPPVPPADASSVKAGQILKATGVTDGYCLALGLEDGRLVEALARQSALTVIGVEPDPNRVDAIRRRLDSAGLYGPRTAVRVGDPLTFPFPPYVASLVVSERPESLALGEDGSATAVFRALRPYGGLACLEIPPDRQEAFAARVRAGGLKQADLRTEGAFTLLARVGALPGSADVSHEGVDSANTFCSQDKLVKLPLGLLWFGGPSVGDLFMGGPAGARPQVTGGRMVLEGQGGFSAVDIYTGRVLWTARMSRSYPAFRGIPTPTPLSPARAASKVARVHGVLFVSLADGIYVIEGGRCLRLDPATGEKMSEFTLPGNAGWGSLAIWDELIIATAGPVALPEAEDRELQSLWESGAGAKLVVMNRHSGDVLWQRDAAYAFRHTAIATDAGKLFCIDRLQEVFADRLSGRAQPADARPKLIALDVRTGSEMWSTTEDVAGTWLSYSAEHDVLVEGPYWGKNRILARSGRDGSVLWSKNIGVYAAIGLIHHDQLVVDQSIYELRTGEHITDYERGYGCGYPSASEHLLLLRTDSSGYYDLENYVGTGNFTGVRSGCVNSLVAAGGILSAPTMADHCVCNYPIETSLALYHDPAADSWTWGGGIEIAGRIGINFGAPGDRLAADGTFWQDYYPMPDYGNAQDLRICPDVPVTTEPRRPDFFRHHPSRMQGDGPTWVAASGVSGLESVTITPRGDDFGPATVRLYFAEPDQLEPGERVFSVMLQGRGVLKDFDIVEQAGGPFRVVMREFKGVRVDGDLTLRFKPSKGQALICGIELIGE